MNSTIKEMAALCHQPDICGICLKRTKILYGHLCGDCNKISPRMLPVVTLKNGKKYFFDKRLRQLRNIENPHDYINLNRGD